MRTLHVADPLRRFADAAAELAVALGLAHEGGLGLRLVLLVAEEPQRIAIGELAGRRDASTTPGDPDRG